MRNGSKDIEEQCMTTMDAMVDDIDRLTAPEDNPLLDPTVRTLLGQIIERDEIPHMEVALYELALWDAYIHRDDIAEVVGRVEKSMTSNYSRALVKSYLAMKRQGRDVSGLVQKYLSPISKADKGSKWITIPEYERSDGTIVEEHRRRIPDDMTRRSLEELQDIANQVKEASESEYGRKQLRSGKGRKFLDEEKYDAAQLLVDDWNRRLQNAQRVIQEAPDHMKRGEETRQAEQEARRIVNEAHEQALRDNKRYDRNQRWDEKSRELDTKIHDPFYIEGAKEALKEETWGKRIVTTADYLTKSKDQRATDTVKFAAASIRDYGPLTGMRIAHAYQRYGGYDVPLRLDTETGEITTEKGDVVPMAGLYETRNWAINTLSQRIPSLKTYSAGSKPPSEGFIISGDGVVIAHAVGRGPDHYIPFNTRHLKKMKKENRVEFVRTRMVGGPTVEDLHAAMMMGADKLTVISNSGTYSLDFTNRSHGVKLEHFQVLTRYQEILDEYQNQTQGRYKGDKTRNRLDHKGYMRALQSISDEFPLHINFNEQSAMEGPNPDLHDFVQPTNRLMDQLKTLFGIETTRSGKVTPLTPSAVKNNGLQVDHGITEGRPIQEWFRGQRSKKPAGYTQQDWEIKILSDLEQDYRRRQRPMPRQWEERLESLLDRRIETESGVSQSYSSQRLDHREKAEEELRNNRYGHVVVSTLDTDNDQTGDRPPSRGEQEFTRRMKSKYNSAYQFIRDYGYDVGSASDLEEAERILETAERALMNRGISGYSREDVWLDFENDVDINFARR